MYSALVGRLAGFSATERKRGFGWFSHTGDYAPPRFPDDVARTSLALDAATAALGRCPAARGLRAFAVRPTDRAGGRAAPGGPKGSGHVRHLGPVDHRAAPDLPRRRCRGRALCPTGPRVPRRGPRLAHRRSDCDRSTGRKVGRLVECPPLPEAGDDCRATYRLVSPPRSRAPRQRGTASPIRRRP
jgi:hypothetical protein